MAVEVKTYRPYKEKVLSDNKGFSKGIKTT